MPSAMLLPGLCRWALAFRRETFSALFLFGACLHWASVHVLYVQIFWWLG